MTGRRFWLALLLLIAIGTSGLRGETRTWTDSKGKHKTQAEFVSYEKSQVTLRKTDGQLVTLQLTKLSREDQRYVHERVRQQREEQKAKEEAEKDSEKENNSATSGTDDDDQDRPASGGRRAPGARQPASDDEELADDEETPDKETPDKETPNEELKDDEPPTDEELEADEQDPPRQTAVANKTTDSKPAPPKKTAAASPVKANNVINSVRGAVYRTETLNNLKQIGVALHGYEAARQRFPGSTTSTQPGQVGLSWRVAILPFLEEKSLYDQFKMNEPWDSEHNLKLVAQMPKVFRSPGSDAEEGYTNYLAVVGPNTVIANAGKGTRVQDITDGTSMTAVVVEVDDDHAVVWTQPADYEWEAGDLGAGLGQIWSGTFFATLADGSSRRIDLSAGPDLLRGLFTRNGGERVEFDE